METRAHIVSMDEVTKGTLNPNETCPATVSNCNSSKNSTPNHHAKTSSSKASYACVVSPKKKEFEVIEVLLDDELKDRDLNLGEFDHSDVSI